MIKKDKRFLAETTYAWPDTFIPIPNCFDAIIKVILLKPLLTPPGDISLISGSSTDDALFDLWFTAATACYLFVIHFGYLKLFLTFEKSL